LNSGIAYNSILGKKLKLPEFRLNVIKQMIQVHSKTDILVSPGRKDRKIKGNHPLHLTSRHFPSKIKSDKDGKKSCQKRCHVHMLTNLKPRIRKDTSYECVDCNTTLYLEPCFKEYHNRLVY